MMIEGCLKHLMENSRFRNVYSLSLKVLDSMRVVVSLDDIDRRRERVLLAVIILCVFGHGCACSVSKVKRGANERTSERGTTRYIISYLSQLSRPVVGECYLWEYLYACKR